MKTPICGILTLNNQQDSLARPHTPPYSIVRRVVAPLSKEPSPSGDDVFCGPSVVFTNVLNPRSAIPRMTELQPILVKKGATIVANATIICGQTIGRYAFIGAGAVVTKSIPDYALAYGNPAIVKGWMCECGEKLDFGSSQKKGQTACHACKKVYGKEGLVVGRKG